MCQVCGGREKLGIEWNRTAGSRMVLTDRQTVLQRAKCISLQRHGLGDPGFCNRVRQVDFLFDSEKGTTICCVGLMINCNICNK